LLRREGYVDRVDEEDILLVARIVAATHDLVPHEIPRRDPQPLDDRGRQRLVGMVERQGQGGQAQHRARSSDSGRPMPLTG
jgi:hypothetical protein